MIKAGNDAYQIRPSPLSPTPPSSQVLPFNIVTVQLHIETPMQPGCVLLLPSHDTKYTRKRTDDQRVSKRHSGPRGLQAT